MTPIQITHGHGERVFRSQASVGRQQIYFIDTEHFRKTQQNCIHHIRATTSLPQRVLFFSANINSKRAHIPGIHDNVLQAIAVQLSPRRPLREHQHRHYCVPNRGEQPPLLGADGVIPLGLGEYVEPLSEARRRTFGILVVFRLRRSGPSPPVSVSVVITARTTAVQLLQVVGVVVVSLILFLLSLGGGGGQVDRRDRLGRGGSVIGVVAGAVAIADAVGGLVFETGDHPAGGGVAVELTWKVCSRKFTS